MSRRLIGTICGHTWGGYYGLLDFDVALPRKPDWNKVLREQSGDFESAHFLHSSYVELRRRRTYPNGYTERVRYVPLHRIQSVRLLLTDGKGG